MKKKIVALMLAAMMASAMVTGCGSGAGDSGSDAKTESTEEAKTEEKTEEKAEDSDYQFVSPQDAVKAAAEGNTHVVDLRDWDTYTAGRVPNSEWCPIFPLEDDSLVDGMTTYAKENLNDGKDIYLICMSGKKGAQKATGVLLDAGIDASKIYTVEGGAKALAEVNGALTTDRTEEKIDWKYAKAADVLAESDAQIVDVRDDETYAAGHLKGSKQVGLKEIDSPEAQTKAYELAETLKKDKPVYFLCYSGNKCAKTAVSVFKDAGYSVDDLLIIENGAKDADVEAAFVKE